MFMLQEDSFKLSSESISVFAIIREVIDEENPPEFDGRRRWIVRRNRGTIILKIIELW